MKPKSKREDSWYILGWAYLVIILVIFADQVSKYSAFYHFPLVCNRAGAFGLDGNTVIFSTIAIFLLIFLLIRARGRFALIPLALIAGGGISNLLDRLMIGCVRDFINIGFGEILRWPAFNLADSAIFLGVLAIIIGVFQPAWRKLK